MHLGGSIDGVGHRLETRHQAVAKALHQDAAMARQYLGDDDADEVCPSANGGGLVLSHEPHRFHEVDQQHDGFLPHEFHARVPHIGSLGRAPCPSCLSTASSFMLIRRREPALLAMPPSEPDALAVAKQCQVAARTRAFT